MPICPREAELVGALLPDADRARFDRELDQALAPPGRPGTCGHSAMSWRPGGTNLPDVLAAGDCVETWHRLLDRPAYLPLGTTAHKQGRVAGETAVGGDREFAGSLGTQVVKVFELAVARTGLRDPDAAEAGWNPVTVGSVQYDHKAYYPGAHQLHLRITGDRHTGRLLGASWSATTTPRWPSASTSPPAPCSTT